MRQVLVFSILCSLPLAAQVRGGLNAAPNPEKPVAVRNQTAQPADEIVTIRHFRIKKGSFDQFLKVSIEGVWPYFEKIGSRPIGMWKVIQPESVPDIAQASPDYREGYLMTA